MFYIQKVNIKVCTSNIFYYIPLKLNWILCGQSVVVRLLKETGRLYIPEEQLTDIVLCVFVCCVGYSLSCLILADESMVQAWLNASYNGTGRYLICLFQYYNHMNIIDGNMRTKLQGRSLTMISNSLCAVYILKVNQSNSFSTILIFKYIVWLCGFT